MFPSLIAAATILQTQSAPPDVPKDHWVFPAVDALFREGLLKGYPAEKQPALKLDRSIKRDLKQAEKWIQSWILAGFGALSLCKPITGYREPTSYEAAVIVHDTLANVESLLKNRQTPTEKRLGIRVHFPEVVKAISMFEPELIKLGGDVPDMMRRLNDLYDSPHCLFHGDQ